MLALRCWRAAVPGSCNNTALVAATSTQRTMAQSALPRSTSRTLTSLSFAPTTQRIFSASTLLPSSATQRPLLANTLSSSLGGFNNQIRTFSASSSLAGRRNTYNPSRRVQKRRHGFLARLRSRGGQMILKRRRQKGKKNLSW